MDSYEATKIVFSRIQVLDPENASKIMGYLLLQDHGDKEMIRLAFGPENLLHNLIIQAKTHLCFSSNSPSTPTSPSPFNSTSRLNNGFEPLLSPNSTSSSLSYASVVNGTNHSNNNSSGDMVDEYQLQDQFSFLNDSKTDDLFDPRLEVSLSSSGYSDPHLHRRSFSVPGMCFGSEDANSGFGWKPCLYFARGFCKNGTTCKFLHGDSATDCGGATITVGSPNKLNELEQCQEAILRSKLAATQQQKLAAASQFLAGSSFPYNRCMNFLLQQQTDSPRSAAVAALMVGDEFHKLGRCRGDRNEFSGLGLGAMNPGSRQIYLTFPADSIFREEDVSSYFSIYGPVQDVRIPYQQKRMFGFVTFLYAETVKLILAKGNPHFVCDSRVLVKPYKEKGKVPDKKQHQQQMDRAEFSACSSPSGLDSREPFDLQLGARMFYNTQDMLLRRKLEEQADLQQAIEMQGRRLLNLQILDMKNRPYRHGVSTSSPAPSPSLSQSPNLLFPVDGIDQDVSGAGNGHNPDAAMSQNGVADNDQQLNPPCNHNNGNGNNSKVEKSNSEESDANESLEHILPDNLFTSPKKSASENTTVFSTTSVDVEGSRNASSSINTPTLSTSSTMNMASLKSCYLQIPRFSSGHGTIGM